MSKNLFYILFFFLLVGARSEANSLDKYLKKELKDYNSFTYEVMTLPRSIKTLDDNRLMIDDERDLRLQKGFAYVPALVKVGGETNKCVITLRVKLYKDVFVANRKIKKGETISRFDFSVEMRDVSTFGDQIISDEKELANYRANMTINKGEILVDRMIEEIPLIKRGDEITVYAQFGSVVVNFHAVAREDGTKGEKIKVIRDDKRIFRAEVIDSKSAIIR